MKIRERALAILLGMVMVLTFMPALTFAAPPEGMDYPYLELQRNGAFESRTAGECEYSDGEGYYTYYDEPELKTGDVIIWHTSDSESVEYSFLSYDEEEGTYYFVDADDNPIELCVEWALDQEEYPFVFGDDGTCTQMFAVVKYGDEDAGEEDIYSPEYEATVYEDSDYSGDEDEDDADLPFGDIPDNCEAIAVGQKKTVNITSQNSGVTFKFTPAVSGIYVFESFDSASAAPDEETDPAGRVVRMDGAEETIVADADDSFAGEDDYHFQVFFPAEAGKTYYLQSTSYEGMECTFGVTLYENKVRGMTLDLGDSVRTAVLYEGQDVYEDEPEFYAYEISDFFRAGDKIYLFYKDGLNVNNLSGKVLGTDYDVYTANNSLEFVNSNGEEVKYSLEDTQEDSLWTVSDTPYPITFTCQGFSDTETLKVLVKRNAGGQGSQGGQGGTTSAGQTVVAPAVPAAPAEYIDLPAVKISKPKAAKKKLTVKWKKISKKNKKKISGVQIQVATDPGFTNIVKNVKAGKKKTSKKISGLKKKTKYYVRIRAYAPGNHYSAWKTKKIKTK